MYELENAEFTAENLLESEFNSFRFSPVDYCKSLNWPLGNNFRKWLNEERYNITYTDKDVMDLEKILIESQDNANDVIDVIENGNVSDFITNCIAGKINQCFDVKKDKPKRK